MATPLRLETELESAEAPMPRLRIEPRKAPVEVIMLAVSAWTGKKRFCEARVLERDGDSMVVIAGAPLEQGEQIWFTQNDCETAMFVHDSAQEGVGFRMDLRRERRRSPRWRVDEPGEIEWLEGDRVKKATVLVVDVSAGGLRIRTSEAIPEQGEVRVKFAGMVRDGEIRYSLPLGGATVAGVEFS